MSNTRKENAGCVNAHPHTQRMDVDIGRSCRRHTLGLRNGINRVTGHAEFFGWLELGWLGAEAPRPFEAGASIANSASEAALLCG